jgi:excisionase family DNA binding protein
MSDLMTLPEVAEAVRAPEGTLRYWRHRGEGPPSFRIGRRVVYRRSDVEAWIERLREEQAS